MKTLWLAVLCVVGSLTATGRSQCVVNVRSTGVAGGFNGGVYSLASLPNGDVVAGGGFTVAGGQPAIGIASWNGSEWSALGGGLNSFAFSMAVHPNGDLIVGGWFTVAGGQPANYIARWNGTTWWPMGTGMNDRVLAVAVLPDGEVIAGGEFTTAGGQPANHIASWDGTAWSPVGTGLNSHVTSLAVLSNGDLVAGGYFVQAGAVPAFNVARWDGVSWSGVGAGLRGGSVFSIAGLPNGDVVAAGQFPLTSDGLTVNGIARWDGTTWSALGSGFPESSVWTVAALPNGDVLAGVQSSPFGGALTYHVARWNGTSWSPVGTGWNSYVTQMIVLPDGGVAVGGGFDTAAGVVSPRMAIVSLDGLVSITAEPAEAAVVPGETASFSVEVEGAALSYQWRHDGVDLVDGDRHAGVTTATLTISNVVAADQGGYTCVITNACESRESRAGLLSFRCLADHNLDGGIDGGDVEAFFFDWEAGLSTADVSQDGGIDGSDVETFFAAWEAGC